MADASRQNNLESDKNTANVPGLILLSKQSDSALDVPQFVVTINNDHVSSQKRRQERWDTLWRGRHGGGH